MTQPTPNIRVNVVTITPQLAEELLGKNPKNRKISRTNYNTVRRAIEHGEWELNGEAIKLSQDGTVLDGQHRLMAVRDTGISIQSLLIEGLPDGTQETMDTGKSRSLSDILAIRGEANAPALAALIRRFVLADRYGFVTAFSAGASGYPLTNREMSDWLEANPWVREYVHPGRAVAKKTPIGGALAGFLIRTFDALDAEDSAFFWERVKDGVNLSEDNPIYALRKAFVPIVEDSRGERNQKYIGALTVKAWNDYRSGRPRSLLKFRVGGAKPETFPEPR